ncbi:MAG: NADH-quinone oxidoreductase subunit C [Desulfobacterales bacterium]
MSFEGFKEELRRHLPEPDKVRELNPAVNGCRLEVRSGPQQVEAIAQAARAAGLFLEAVTAIDFKDGMHAIYLYNACEVPSRVRVRVVMKPDEPLPTISRIYNAALWYEREVFDLFGIRFDGHPDLRRLLLPEEADFHPLAKHFGKVHAYRNAQEIYGDPAA